MGHFTEFARELEKKIRAELERELQEAPASRSAMGSTEDLPLGFSWILGQQTEISPDKGPPKSRAHHAYGVRIRPRRPHLLSEKQERALDLVRSFGLDLPQGFNRQELKSIWKELAKKTHPDCGGSNEQFRSAQAAYLELQLIFQKTNH